jgi:hypothetical protein
MNTIEEITVRRLVSLAHDNVAEASAWCMYGGTLTRPALTAQIDALRDTLQGIDNSLAEGLEVPEHEVLRVLQQACILYGKALVAKGDFPS